MKSNIDLGKPPNDDFASQMTILFYQNLTLHSSQITLSIQKNKKGIEYLILKFSFLPLSILFPEQITKATKSLLRRYGLILVTCFSCQSKEVSARYVKVFLTYFYWVEGPVTRPNPRSHHIVPN